MLFRSEQPSCESSVLPLLLSVSSEVSSQLSLEGSKLPKVVLGESGKSGSVLSCPVGWLSDVGDLLLEIFSQSLVLFLLVFELLSEGSDQLLQRFDLLEKSILFAVLTASEWSDLSSSHEIRVEPVSPVGVLLDESLKQLGEAEDSSLEQTIVESLVSPVLKKPSENLQEVGDELVEVITAFHIGVSEDTGSLVKKSSELVDGVSQPYSVSLDLTPLLSDGVGEILSPRRSGSSLTLSISLFWDRPLDAELLAVLPLLGADGQGLTREAELVEVQTPVDFSEQVVASSPQSHSVVVVSGVPPPSQVKA